MTEPLSPDQVFIRKLTDIVLENLENENFGVKELAHASGMSQYRLGRRLNSVNRKTITQFIREIRLQKALEMLQENALTIAEVAYRSGFSSPTYFNKCFHEYFGHPPGTIKKGNLSDSELKLITQNHSGKIADKSIWSTYFSSVYGIILLVMLTGSTGVFIYKHFNNILRNDSRISSDNRISIAVMPFSNMTNDTMLNIWQDGIQVSLVTFLNNYSNELKVRQPGTVQTLLQSKSFTNYSMFSPDVARELSKGMDADLFISGSLIKSSDVVRLISQIFDSGKGEVLKSFEIQGPAKESMMLYLIDSLKHQIGSFLLISKLKMEEPYYDRFPRGSDISPEAYRYSNYGSRAASKMDWTTAIEMYSKALEIDSIMGERGVYASLTSMYLNLGMYKEAKEWCLRGYKKLDKMDHWEELTINYHYANLFETPAEAIKYAEQMVNIDDQLTSGHWKLGDMYFSLQQWGNAIPEFEKVLELYHNWKLKPFFLANYSELGYAYHKTGNYKKERKLYKKAQTDFPDHPEIMDQYAILAFELGDTVEANKWIRKYVTEREEQSWSEAKIASSLGYIFSEGGYPDKGESYFRKAIILEPENFTLQHRLARFLIDKERNIHEGLEIEENLLRKEPDNYSYLDVKGLGLFKQGKYTEALEILEKSWDLRMENSIYNHAAFLHLKEAKISAAKRY